MTLGVHAKVLLYVWSYDTTLSTEKQQRHMIFWKLQINGRSNHLYR